MLCYFVRRLIQAYLGDALGAGDADRLRRHCERCPSCAAAMREAERAARLVASLPRRSLAGSDADALLARVRARGQERLGEWLLGTPAPVAVLRKPFWARVAERWDAVRQGAALLSFQALSRPALPTYAALPVAAMLLVILYRGVPDTAKVERVGGSPEALAVRNEAQIPALGGKLKPRRLDSLPNAPVPGMAAPGSRSGGPGMGSASGPGSAPGRAVPGGPPAAAPGMPGTPEGSVVYSDADAGRRLGGATAPAAPAVTRGAPAQRPAGGAYRFGVEYEPATTAAGKGRAPTRMAPPPPAAGASLGRGRAAPRAMPDIPPSAPSAAGARLDEAASGSRSTAMPAVATPPPAPLPPMESERGIPVAREVAAVVPPARPMPTKPAIGAIRNIQGPAPAPRETAAVPAPPPPGGPGGLAGGGGFGAGGADANSAGGGARGMGAEPAAGGAPRLAQEAPRSTAAVSTPVRMRRSAEPESLDGAAAVKRAPADPRANQQSQLRQEKRDTERGTAELVRLLEGRAEDAREAARELGRRREKRAVEALGKALRTHADAGVREAAAGALAEIGSREARALLRAAAERDGPGKDAARKALDGKRE